MQSSGVMPEDVDYVNAHATSTMAGDMAEYRALRAAIPGDHVRMNATKSMIGHLLGGAGAVEAVATVQAIQTGMTAAIGHWPVPSIPCMGQALSASVSAHASLIVHLCSTQDCQRAVRRLHEARPVFAGMLHPTINLDNPEDELDMSIIVAGEKAKHNVDVALTNSFGFGGHNSSIIFSKYQE